MTENLKHLARFLAKIVHDNDNMILKSLSGEKHIPPWFDNYVRLQGTKNQLALAKCAEQECDPVKAQEALNWLIDEVTRC